MNRAEREAWVWLAAHDAAVARGAKLDAPAAGDAAVRRERGRIRREARERRAEALARSADEAAHRARIAGIHRAA